MVQKERINRKQVAIGVFLWLCLFVLVISISYFPLSSNKAVALPFLDTNREKAVLFFGYRSCGDICPTTLIQLNRIVKSWPQTSQAPEVVFIDIDRNSDSASASRYAQGFNPGFIGYHPSPAELKQLSADFGLNFKQDGNNIAHRGRTYLVEESRGEWRLTKTYNPNKFSIDKLTSEHL